MAELFFFFFQFYESQHFVPPSNESRRRFPERAFLMYFSKAEVMLSDESWDYCFTRGCCCSSFSTPPTPRPAYCGLLNYRGQRSTDTWRESAAATAGDLCFFFIDGVKVSERLWFCRANFLQPKPKSVGVGNCDLVHLWSEETLPHVCQQGGSLEDFPSLGFSLLDIFQPKQRRGRKYVESEDSLTNCKKQPDTLALA